MPTYRTGNSVYRVRHVHPGRMGATQSGGAANTANATFGLTRGAYLPMLGKNRLTQLLSHIEVAGGTTFPQACDVSATFAVALTKRANLVKALTSTMAVALTKRVDKLLAIGATLTVALTKRVNKLLAVTGTWTAAATAFKVVLLALAVNVTFTVARVLRVNKLLAVTGTWAVAAAKRISKTLAIAATYAVAATKQVAKTLAVAGSWLVEIANVVIPGAGVTIPITLEVTMPMVVSFAQTVTEFVFTFAERAVIMTGDMFPSIGRNRRRPYRNRKRRG